MAVFSHYFFSGVLRFIDTISDAGLSPLALHAAQGHTAIVKILLEHGAKLVPCNGAKSKFNSFFQELAETIHTLGYYKFSKAEAIKTPNIL